MGDMRTYKEGEFLNFDAFVILNGIAYVIVKINKDDSNGVAVYSLNSSQII